jgi:hypothetical protein
LAYWTRSSFRRLAPKVDTTCAADEFIESMKSVVTSVELSPPPMLFGESFSK